MATTTWEPAAAPPGEGSTGPRLHETDRVRDMGMVRLFVSDVLLGEGAQELSDDEWETLCRTEEGAESNEHAITRVVLTAYAMRRAAAEGAPPLRPFDSSPTTAGPPRPDADVTGEAGRSSWSPVEWTATEVAPLIPVGFGVARVPESEASAYPCADTLPLVEAEGKETRTAPFLAASVTAWPISPDPSPEAVALAPVPPAKRPRHGERKWAKRSAGVSTATARPNAHAATDRLGGRRREVLLVATSWVRNIGAIILLFVAWQLWGTAITQHHSQSAFKSQFDAGLHHAVVKPPPGFSLVSAATRIPDPPQGTVMAHLQVPKIGLDQFVVSGTSEADLAKGPGHYLGTAMPGQAGNVAIAGHRTTHGAPFNRLAELAVGDSIYLTTSTGIKLTYIVSAVPVAVSPKDVTVLNNFGDDRVTLTTCNPEYSAVQRLIVAAAYLPPGANHPPPIVKGTGKPYALASTVTSGWNTTLLPLVLVESAALIGLGLAFRKLSSIYGKGARWLILGPIWLALLLALFETLTNFLPAAV
jgi:LPXTG-site transpeptidase (sortase) family protein